MQAQEINYEIQFDRIQNIALLGIQRALTFIKFAETGTYDLTTVNKPPRNEGEIMSNDFVSPIQESDFAARKSDFITWNLNNGLNEIVESFFVFLEMLYFCLDATNTRRRVKLGDVLADVIRNWQNEVRDSLRSQNKIKSLMEKGIEFSDIDKQIIECFWEIRNLLSHNLGIADNRKKLDISQGKITLKWYRWEIFVKLESGKEVALTR